MKKTIKVTVLNKVTIKIMHPMTIIIPYTHSNNAAHIVNSNVAHNAGNKDAHIGHNNAAHNNRNKASQY